MRLPLEKQRSVGARRIALLASCLWWASAASGPSSARAFEAHVDDRGRFVVPAPEAPPLPTPPPLRFGDEPEPAPGGGEMLRLEPAAEGE